MSDPRPVNCRHRLQDEGKAYPRSSCQACGATVATGLGKRCHWTHETTAQNTTAPPRDSRFEDWQERLSPTLYIRFTRGPDYEDAFLCIDDGEPDMRAVARMSFTQARMLQAAMTDGSDELATLRTRLAEVDAENERRSQAAQDVLAERRRQMEVEGWTPEHDDKHTAGEIPRAAVCYALIAASPPLRAEYRPGHPPREWHWHSSWWKPKTPRRDLIRAAALIIAELVETGVIPKPTE